MSLRRTSQIVTAITDEVLKSILAEKPIKALARDVNKNRAVLYRVWPSISLTLALVITIGSIGLVGYVAIKVF
jgi:hypothetical protein